MKEIVKFAFWFWVGYTVTTKLGPAVQAKIEAADLDRMWEIWDEEAA
jgi:hypothetical protein